MQDTRPDPRARRRLEVGLALLADRRAAEATEAIRAALELDPADAEAWYSLGQALEASSDAAAAEAYRRALACDPADRMGAALRLALLGAAPAPERLPEAHVRTLFDQYAPRFDTALTGRLGYRAPALLREAVDTVEPRPDPLDILDLGCGTGLSGEAFRDRARRLDGVDLSPAMAALARSRGIYDSVEVDEIGAALAATDRRYDLVLAADVLVYLGDLAPTFAGVRRVLRFAGWFAFTLECHEGPEPWRLGPHHRYSHAPVAVAGWALSAGFSVLGLNPITARTEAGAPVPGTLAVLRAA